MELQLGLNFILLAFRSKEVFLEEQKLDAKLKELRRQWPFGTGRLAVLQTALVERHFTSGRFSPAFFAPKATLASFYSD